MRFVLEFHWHKHQNIFIIRISFEKLMRSHLVPLNQRTMQKFKFYTFSQVNTEIQYQRNRLITA